MYSAAVYNYFNDGRPKPRGRKRRIPIPKPSRTRQIYTCKSCGRKFYKAPPKRHEIDTEHVKQPVNIVYEKVLLIWKYAKSLLSNTTHGSDPQKCSFKIIAHKSYKKRSLQKEIISKSSSVSPQFYCKNCEKRKIEKKKSKELKEEHKPNDRPLNEHKYNIKKKRKLGKKRYRGKALHTTDESTEETHSFECIRGKKRHNKLCPRKSTPSIQQKKPICTCNNNLTNTRAIKRVVAKKQQATKKIRNAAKKPFLPKRKISINKNKRKFRKESRKKINRFASWQYLQHALNTVNESPSGSISGDKSPVYLTFEEYCLILEAIDTDSSSTERFRNIGEDLVENAEEATGSTDEPSDGKTEDVATNTDHLIENTEDASTNTEPIWEYSEGLTTNTEPISEVEELTKNVEQTSNEITEELERLSETTETLDAINDPPSEEFDANIYQPSETNAEIEQNSDDEQNKEIIDNNMNIVPNNSFVDINEMGQSEKNVDSVLLSETIEKIQKINNEGNKSEENIEQTAASEDSEHQTKVVDEAAEN